ncbi:MAG: hypothetical protein GX986_01300 [Firmicutes bacterium]|nr:hypothetical protein [Bacillota bacterium]
MLWLPLIDKLLQSKVAPMLLACLGILLVIALVLGSSEPRAQAFINIRDTVEVAMDDLFQGPVEIGSADLSSLNRISVRDIVVKDPLDDTVVLLEVDELILRYSIIGLVVHMNSVEKAIQEIVLRNPRLFIQTEGNGRWNISRLFKKQSGSDGSTLDLLIRVEKGRTELVGSNLGIGTIAIGLDGALNVAGSALKLEQTAIGVFGSEFEAYGSLDQGNVDLTLKGSKIDLANVTACFPQTKETVIRGKATMEVRAGGTLANPLLDGMISMGPGSLEFPSYDNLEYSIDGLEAFFRYTEQALEITKLEIAQREARFQARGVIDVKGNMRLDVIAQAFDLAENLRFIESYGIAGQANLAGVLSGTVLHPDFQGELHIAKGSLWGQSYDELRGHIALDLKDVQVTGCNIRKGRSIYAIAGSMGFEPVPEMDITVQSSGGRAEDVLAVLRIPGDLVGRVDGTLEFRGNKDDLVTKGKIHMTEGRFQEQLFDSATAEFVMDAKQVRITQGRIGLGGGTLAFSGATQSDGVLLLDIQAQDILADRFLLLKDVADTLQGRLDLTGTASLKGTLAKPWLRLRLATDEISGETLATEVTEVDVLLNGRQIVVNGKEIRPLAPRPN